MRLLPGRGLDSGRPPPVDVALLSEELDGFWPASPTAISSPGKSSESRKLVDVAFSGNGEPTSSPEFPAAVAAVQGPAARGLAGTILLRLITNGSPAPSDQGPGGDPRSRIVGGEVWFQSRSGRCGGRGSRQWRSPTRDGSRQSSPLRQPGAHLGADLLVCLRRAAPDAAARQAYCELIAQAGTASAGSISMVWRGLPAARGSRLARLDVGDLEAFAAEIEMKTGVRTLVSP